MASGGLPPAREALLKSYNTRMKEDVRCMLENFQEILLLARRDSNMQLRKATQVEQDTLEMQVRSSNMVRAGESLLKIVSELKQYTILNDFHSANEAIMANAHMTRITQAEIDKRLTALRDEMNGDLFDMEEEYYTSIHK